MEIPQFSAVRTQEYRDTAIVELTKAPRIRTCTPRQELLQFVGNEVPEKDRDPIRVIQKHHRVFRAKNEAWLLNASISLILQGWLSPCHEFIEKPNQGIARIPKGRPDVGGQAVAHAKTACQVRVSAIHREGKGGLISLVKELRPSARFQELPHNRLASLERREHQGRRAVSCLRILIRAGVEQCRDNLRPAGCSGHMESGHPSRVGRIDLGSAPKRLLNISRRTRARQIKQPGTLGGRRHVQEGWKECDEDATPTAEQLWESHEHRTPDAGVLII